MLRQAGYDDGIGKAGLLTVLTVLTVLAVLTVLTVTVRCANQARIRTWSVVITGNVSSNQVSGVVQRATGLFFF
jgi:hypothetical protein